MPEFYEPILNLTDPEHHNTMGAFLTLKDPVNGEILRDAVEAPRTPSRRKAFPAERLIRIFDAEIRKTAERRRRTSVNSVKGLYRYPFFLYNTYENSGTAVQSDHTGAGLPCGERETVGSRPHRKIKPKTA
jgi:hypothetical protein